MSRAFSEALVQGPNPVLGFPASFDTLERLSRSVSRPGMRCLEIGSWLGNSAILLGRVCREFGGEVTCVDTWQGSESAQVLADLAEEHDIYGQFQNNVARAGLREFVRPIREASAVAIASLRGEQFDLVFIDGDHRYEFVRQDIQDYAPLVKPGGILCGHDCLGHLDEFEPSWIFDHLEDAHVEHPEIEGVGIHPGVVLAVHELVPNAYIENEVWWTHR